MPDPQDTKIFLPPPSEWGVRSIRFTAFTDPEAVEYSSTWWLNVVEEPPDRRLSEPKKGLNQDESDLRDGVKFILTVETGRINWSLTMPSLEWGITPDSFTTLGSFTEVLEEFGTLMGRWFDFEDCPVARRIALGSILVYPVADKVEGYLQLNKYLADVRIDPEGSSDFQYRINRPRTATMGHERIVINRLSTWTVASLSVGRVEAGVKKPQATLIRNYHTCQIELDINSDQHFTGTLNPKIQSNLFEEFKQFALEIVAEGDIP